MTCGIHDHHYAAGFYDQPYSTVCKKENQSIVRNNTLGMKCSNAMKCLFIFTMWTLAVDLDGAAAASTTTLMRSNQATMSDLQYGLEIPGSERVELLDGEEDGALVDRQIVDPYKEEEPTHELKLQASKARLAEYYRRYHEIDSVQVRKSKAKSDLQPSRRRRPGRGEISAGKEDVEDNDQAKYGDSITIQELVDDGLVEGKHGTDSTVSESDRVAQQIQSRALIKHEYGQIDQSNIEADDMQPVDESMENSRGWGAPEYADIHDGAGQRKLKSKRLPKKKSQYSEGGINEVAIAGAHESKIDAHAHNLARRIDGEYESVTTPPVTTTSRVDHNVQDALPRDAGKEKSDKAKTKEEVVVAEEREEDKELVAEYNLGEPIKDWDLKREEWTREHPEVKHEQLFILTGTQPWPCTNAEGDHLLLRCFKNKVDYSRIHGVGLFYNTALLDAHMPTFWAKLPVVRATMLAHPEVEWIWWLDADAIITDMEFNIPLHRYTAYNLVVHGWESVIFEKRSWLGLNAGSFLLRNCQWSLELLERWACMGPKAPMGDAYRHILSDFLPDRPHNPTDDQAALVYLLIKERQRWAGKLRVELDFYLSGYWLELMDGFEATEERYRSMEQQHAELLTLLERQGAVGKEKLVAAIGRARQQHLSNSGTSVQERRPFVTHFTGCQPCSGNHNNIYSKEQCHDGLVRALNYADDQVLSTLGYQHRALHLPDVLPATA